jgi:hypothetical protein
LVVQQTESQATTLPAQPATAETAAVPAAVALLKSLAEMPVDMPVAVNKPGQLRKPVQSAKAETALKHTTTEPAVEAVAVEATLAVEQAETALTPHPVLAAAAALPSLAE